MDWLWHGVSLILISMLDWMVYTLVSASYSVFLAVSEINLFATDGGAAIYSEITKQIYSVIGIAMIFVFAYQLLLLVINPDGNGQSSPSKMFKDTIISIIFVIVMPTIFNYMTIFQGHVLRNNTIPAIVLGTNASTDAGDGAGNKLAMMIYISFYHPQGTTYSTFYDTDGELKSQPGSECTDSEVCDTFMDALESFEEDYKISSITGVTSLRHAIDSDTGMSYMWLVVTACGCAVIYFFISYTIDIGVRAVKLGFLQLIAPIPVIMRVFPKAKKTFETWFGELIRTYLEVFLRLAVIFFIVRLCQLVPEFINAIFTSDNNVSGNSLVRCAATVCLILGLLKFAKDAPELIKTMFSTNGGLFSGLNLKPGVAKRMEENTFGMKAIGAGLGAVSGAIGAGRNAFNASTAKRDDKDNVGKRYDARALGATVIGATRGMLAGGKHGMQHQSEKFSKKDIAEAMYDASDVARNKVTKQTKVGKAISGVADTIEHMKTGYQQGGLQGASESLKVDGEKLGKEIGKEIRKPLDRITGVTGGSKQVELLGQVKNLVSGMEDMLSDDISKNLEQQMKTVFSNIGVAGGWQKQATFNYDASDIADDGTMSTRLQNAIARATAAGTATEAQIIDQIRNGGSYSETRMIDQNDIGSKEFMDFAKEITEQLKSTKAAHQAERANNPEIKKMLQQQAADIEKVLSQNSAYFSEDAMTALSNGLSMNIKDLMKEVKKIRENGAEVSLNPQLVSDITQLSENASIYSAAIKKEEAKKQQEKK